MTLDPNEKNWFEKHPFTTTIMVLILIVAAGTGLKILQQKYFPAEMRDYQEPVFLNMTFEEVDAYFNMDSNLTKEAQDALFDLDYRYNAFKWTCKPISCQELMGVPTIKLVCDEYGFTEDVRIVMKEDCADAVQEAQVTVVFQLISKTTGEYYLGRSGKMIAE